jgi:hypothetical protein
MKSKFKVLQIFLILTMSSVGAFCQVPYKLNLKENLPVTINISKEKQIGLYFVVRPKYSNFIHYFDIIDNSCSAFTDGSMRNGQAIKMGCHLEAPEVVVGFEALWTKNPDSAKIGDVAVFGATEVPVQKFMPSEPMDYLKIGTVFSDQELRTQNPDQAAFAKFFEHLNEYIVNGLKTRMVCDDYRWIPGSDQNYNAPVSFHAPVWSLESSYMNFETKVTEVRKTSDVYGLTFNANPKSRTLSFLFNHANPAEALKSKSSPGTQLLIPDGNVFTKAQITALKSDTETCFITLGPNSDQPGPFEQLSAHQKPKPELVEPLLAAPNMVQEGLRGLDSEFDGILSQALAKPYLLH